MSVFREWPLSCLAFVAALLLYAACGSPTPDTYGRVELLVGLLLILSVRLPDFRGHGLLLLPLLYGFFVPFLTGLVRGAAPSDIFRDFVPFLFMFLVVVYREHVVFLGARFYWLLAVMGCLFSIRAVLPFWRLAAGREGAFSMGTPADLLYLANSPEVLFAALWFLGAGFYALFYDGRIRCGALLVACAGLPVLAMVFMMQRAGLGAVAALFLILLAGLIRRFPLRFLGAILLTCACALPLWPVFSFVVDGLLRKTHVVGLNSRLQEWEAVLALLSRDWGVALFGYGWGTRFENPAVGGLPVLYTHSLASSLLLKTGFTGTFLVLAGLGAGCIRAFPEIFRNRLLFWALIFPLAISGILYASYKSLGFGLILLVFLEKAYQKLETNSPVVA